MENTFLLLKAKILEKAPIDYQAQLEDFLLYITNTFIKRVDVNDNIREPLFPIILSNVNNSVLEEWPRTNNAMECWHRRFDTRFPKAKMKLSAFILRLKDEYEYIRVKLLQYELNPASPINGQGRRKDVFCNEKQIKALVQNNDDFSTVEFCKKNSTSFIKLLDMFCFFYCYVYCCYFWLKFFFYVL